MSALRWIRGLLLVSLLSGLLPNGGGSPVRADQEPGQPLKVDWSQATLNDGAHSVRSLRIEGALQPEHPVEGGMLRVKGSVVERLDAARAVVWRHDAGRFVDLKFLTEHDGTVILAESTSGLFVQPKPGVALRRLRLSDGQKLETLVIPATPGEKPRRGEILGAVTIGQALFVLSQSLDWSDETAWLTRRYQVDRFQETWTWSRSFEPEPPLPADQIEPIRRARDLANLQPLSRMGDLLVVCAGPRESVIVLKGATGETRWQIPRLWEYQKGFIGPSVFSHHIDRYGLNHFDGHAQGRWKTADGRRSIPDWERTPKGADNLEARKDRAAKLRGSIVAGPAVLQVADGKWPDYSLFVVTSQTREILSPERLEECVVYELDDGGDCIGMVTVPRFVDPTQFRVLHDSVVWHSEQSDRLRLFPSSRTHHPLGGGIGNSGKTIDIEWQPARYGQTPLAREARTAWLRQGVFAQAAVFRGETLLSVTEGGFIEREDSGVFRYPLRLIDFDSGESRRLMLDLPFTGTVLPPEGKGTRQGDQYVADTPFLMTIESLAIREKELLVEFHYGYFQWTLAFDIDELLGAEK